MEQELYSYNCCNYPDFKKIAFGAHGYIVQVCDAIKD